MNRPIESSGVQVLLDRASVVFLGSFNPSIFQPMWFGHHGLLRDSEAAEATVTLVNPQLSQFNTEWLEVQVTHDRFMALSRNGGYEEPLLDLVIATFTLLEHTPLRAVGINREVQLQFDSTERWHQFGFTIAPREIWSEVLPSPGLVSLQVQGQRGEVSDVVNVFVTNRGPKRADLSINEHRAIEKPEGTSTALRILRESWESAKAEGDRIVNHVLSKIR